MSAEPPSAHEDPSPPRPDEAQRRLPPDAYPPPSYPPGSYPPGSPPPPGYPPSGYPPPGYPPGYPPPGYPPNGRPPEAWPGANGPAGPNGPASPGGPGGPRQHAYRTPYGSGPPPGGGGPPTSARPGGRQRSLVWLIVAIAVVAILVRSHRISSTDVILFCVLIPSVILHEVSHGVVALWCGDDTAKRAGRITLNPIRHVTVFGTIIVPIITVLAGVGYFGWAKPVPVNVGRLRSPRNQGVLVALAGPLTNIVLAAIFGVIFYLVYAAHSAGPVATSLGARILFYAGFINVWVACFNLIPVPPLDGSALIERLLPRSWWPGYLRMRPYGMIVIIGALMLMSFAHTSPLQHVVTDLLTWWAHLVHAV